MLGLAKTGQIIQSLAADDGVFLGINEIIRTGIRAHILHDNIFLHS